MANSPMGFFANGCSKEETRRQKDSMIKDMLKLSYEDWPKMPLEILRSLFWSWPDRVMAVHKAVQSQRNAAGRTKTEIVGNFSNRLTSTELPVFS